MAKHFGVRAGIRDFLREVDEQVHAGVDRDTAQERVAQSYGFPNWKRLKTACRMTTALWDKDIETVRELIQADPALLHESARGVKSHWGPPMSHAANLGRNEIVRMLHEMGAQDLQHAFDRACLQGKLDTAQMLYDWGARPTPGCVMGPCETLNPHGLQFLLDRGAELADRNGDPLAPIAIILEIYSRGREGKHRCLDIVEAQGVKLPDTPPMAIHRGRIDKLEEHLKRDPQLLSRTFSHEEIYPPELGCHADHSLALHGTPIAGGTLLHMAVDFDEIEIARWLLDHGADVNAPAVMDAEGFGGHTPLFGCVVSQPYAANARFDDEFARLLLDRGADVNIRASLRKRLRFVEDESMHEYRGVTPLEWGQRFHNKMWVSPAVVSLLASLSAH